MGNGPASAGAFHLDDCEVADIGLERARRS